MRRERRHFARVQEVCGGCCTGRMHAALMKALMPRRSSAKFRDPATTIEKREKPMQEETELVRSKRKLGILARRKNIQRIGRSVSAR